MSIGALAGGLYAANRLSALKEFALGITRRRMYSLLDVSWQGSGLIAGDKLRHLLEQQLGDKKVEDLPIPFISIATEYASGHELWLRSGPLAPAIRASYALPGLFRPVEINGQWFHRWRRGQSSAGDRMPGAGARIVIGVTLGPNRFRAQ